MNDEIMNNDWNNAVRIAKMPECSQCEILKSQIALLRADAERLAERLLDASTTGNGYGQIECEYCGNVQEDGHTTDCIVGRALDQHNALMKQLDGVEQVKPDEWAKAAKQTLDENKAAWEELGKE